MRCLCGSVVLSVINVWLWQPGAPGAGERGKPFLIPRGQLAADRVLEKVTKAVVYMDTGTARSISPMRATALARASALLRSTGCSSTSEPAAAFFNAGKPKYSCCLSSRKSVSLLPGVLRNKTRPVCFL